MTVTATSEYRDLALQSSNDMMAHDSRRVLGRYAEAALQIRNAGDGRLRMGQIMADASDYPQAAADWISAAACFYLATDPKQMKDALERAQELDRKGKIPPERCDIHAALKEREEELKTLNNKLTHFINEYPRRPDSSRAGGQETLDWLLPQVRELPGCWRLHAAIANRAMRLGQLPLAFKHQEWAERFDSGNPDLVAFRVTLLIASGERERGVELGRGVLKTHPEMRHLRVLVASALAFQPGASATDWEEAIKLLEPLGEDRSSDFMDRVVPLALTAALLHGVGREDEYRRLLDSFNQLAITIKAPTEQAIVTGLRDSLPQVFPPPGSNGVHPSEKPDHATLRRVFEPFTTLVGAAA